ncbi:MAG: dihydroorotase family protein [Malacoplasma sp.]|nr:dihydroorotase family protein [Malacoplasma sp.]
MLTLLKNCLLSTSKKVDILIKDSIIEKISEAELDNEYYLNQKIDAVFDMKCNLIMPGFIDAFSRIKKQSSYSSSDYETESRACAYGGITTFVDIPSAPINEKYLDAITNKVNDASENSHVNFGFVVSVSDLSNLNELEKIQDYSVGTIININSRTINDRISNSQRLADTLRVSKLVLLHLSGFDIDLFFSICEDKNTKLVFYDITNENDLEKILSYKKEGYNIRTATSINYLLFNRDMIANEYKRKTITTEYKLGTMLNNLGLWNAIKDRKIDMITSDHTPITLIEKFETEQKGLPNFETMFSILFDSCYYKRIPITILEDVLCKNPAKVCGFKNKGEIKEGYDADLVVINTTKRWWIKNEDIVSSARWTPFNDYRISGRVMMTFVNGQLVYNYINQMMPIRNVKAGKLAEFDDLGRNN